MKPPGSIVGNQRSPLHGRHSVADPRPPESWHNEALGVRGWDDTARVVAGASRPLNGAHSVADPRPNDMRSGGFGVMGYEETAGTVAGESLPTNGKFAVADPRPTQPNQTYAPIRREEMDRPGGDGERSGGTQGVARIRSPTRASMGKPLFNNIFRVVAFDQASPAVAGPGGAAGGAAVADPRMADSDYTTTKYKITPWDGQSRAVIGASTTGDGAFAVADPRGGGPDPGKLHGNHRCRGMGRCPKPGRHRNAGRTARRPLRILDPTHGRNAHQNKMKVIGYDEAAPVVTTSDRVGSGALSVADPRPVCLNADSRDGYMTQGHYGVVGWDNASRRDPRPPEEQ
jgi:hypothetical protein